MNKPIVICEDSFQNAWAQAFLKLHTNQWNAWNIVVQIEHPEFFDIKINSLFEDFTNNNNLISPKHVAHTIFPQTFFTNGISKKRLYYKYWRFFKRPRKDPRSGWGTYFARMIKYPTANGDIDQLGDIINNINNRSKNYGASYTMVIPCPDRDLNKIMGSPCLNYITIQTEKTPNQNNKKIINLLAVYRNHDFTRRAYGNYLGLCNLLKYIAHETNSQIGTLTCVSSHASVPDYRSELLGIANNILGISS
jgi:thymidylate synthase